MCRRLDRSIFHTCVQAFTAAAGLVTLCLFLQQMSKKSRHFKLTDAGKVDLLSRLVVCSPSRQLRSSVIVGIESSVAAC